MNIFRIYTRVLFRRRFKRVWIRQEYRPGEESRTVYYLNHNSWWDGLVPFLLNEYRFHQNARALMEDKQLKKYSFFRKIGVFSVNRDDPRKAITSLRYAVQSMLRERASLFVYPEGEIRPPGSPLVFEGGLAWLQSKIKDVDFVPIGIHMHTIRHGKPELHLHIGKPAEVSADRSNQEATALFEKKLEEMLKELRSTAGFDESRYERFI